jgi:hypothetical protein
MTLAALGLAAAGSALGTAAGDKIARGVSSGQTTSTSSAGTVRNTSQLDPQQLQQILDDISNAERQGRADITGGISAALGILRGDPGAQERQQAENRIRQNAEFQAREQLAPQIMQAMQAGNFNATAGSKDIETILKRNFGGTGGGSLSQDPFRVIDPSQIKINNDGTVTVSGIRSGSDAGTLLSGTFNISDSDIRQQIQQLPEQIDSIAAPFIAQFKQDNASLYQGATDTVDPFLRANQQINLSALNQMAALSGIAGSGGQPALSSEQIQQRLENTPGFQFRRDQGQQAIERSASSRGLLESGAILKGLNEFGQGLASQEFGAEHARLATLAGTATAEYPGAS